MERVKYRNRNLTSEQVKARPERNQGQSSIYALIDPRNNEIRYIGRTIKSIESRLSGHLSMSSDAATSKWILELSLENLVPSIETIEECSPGDAKSREIFWTLHFAESGSNLLNTQNKQKYTSRNLPTMLVCQGELAASRFGITFSELVERAIEMYLRVYLK